MASTLMHLIIKSVKFDELLDIVTGVFVEFLSLTLRAKLIVQLKYVIAESTVETG